MQPTKRDKVKIFISYAPADKELREKLEEHLSSLKDSGETIIWQDQEILAGANWEDYINTSLKEADVILLLVSASFIASKYHWNKEVRAALQRYKAGTVRVIPIILRPVDWRTTPLGQLQALPTSAKAITRWDDQDDAFEDVAKGIREVVENIQNKRQQDGEIVTDPTPPHSVKEEPKEEMPAFALQPHPPKGLSRRKVVAGLVCGSALVGGSLIGFTVLQRKGDSPAGITTQGTATPSRPLSTTSTHPDQIVQKWIFPTGGPVYSSPTVQDGVVYIGSNDRKIYAIDTKTGRLNWAFTCSGGVQSSPTVVNDVLYIGSYDQNVYALNAKTGRKIWAFLLTGGVYSSPAIYNGVVYVGSTDGKIYAIYASTGQQMWIFSTGGPVYSSPTVQDGVVYIGCSDDKIYAIDATTGQSKWIFRTGSDVESTPTVVDGILYVGSNDTKMYAIEASTHQKMWLPFPTGKKVASSPTVVNDILYFGSDDQNVYAINANTGQKMWAFLTNGIVHSTPTVRNGVLYIGSDDGKIYAIDTKTGRQKWSPFSTRNGVWSSPTVVNDVLYFGSLDHNVYALTLPTS